MTYKKSSLGNPKAIHSSAQPLSGLGWKVRIGVLMLFLAAFFAAAFFEQRLNPESVEDVEASLSNHDDSNQIPERHKLFSQHFEETLFTETITSPSSEIISTREQFITASSAQSLAIDQATSPTSTSMVQETYDDQGTSSEYQGTNNSNQINEDQGNSGGASIGLSNNRRFNNQRRRAASRLSLPEEVTDGGEMDMVFERQNTNIPQKLTPAEVGRELARVARMVRNCSIDVETHQVQVDVSIGGETGSVTDVQIIGPLGGTTAGDCISRAIRRAQFHNFKDESLTVRNFPFILNVSSN